MFGAGLDLWTDALWFKSVGFDSVFFTRLTATVGLFAGAGLLAAVVLLGNLLLARRLSPPPVEGGGGSIRGFFERLNEAAAQAGDPRRGRSGPPFGDGRGSFGGPQAINFEATELPDLTPIAGIALTAIAIFTAITIGASVGGAWQTVLLWIHRVPFSPETGTVVTDPIFGRDIGFFLFELPFLRLVQGLFNGLVVAALVLSLASTCWRHRGADSCSRPQCGSTWPILARAVPPVRGVRLPARQVRARLQQPGHRDRVSASRTRTPSSSRTTS